GSTSSAISPGHVAARFLNSMVVSAPSPKPTIARLTITQGSRQSSRTTTPSSVSPANTARNPQALFARCEKRPARRIVITVAMKLAIVNGISAIAVYRLLRPCATSTYSGIRNVTPEPTAPKQAAPIVKPLAEEVHERCDEHQDRERQTPARPRRDGAGDEEGGREAQAVDAGQPCERPFPLLDTVVIGHERDRSERAAKEAPAAHDGPQARTRQDARSDDER